MPDDVSPLNRVQRNLRFIVWMMAANLVLATINLALSVLIVTRLSR